MAEVIRPRIELDQFYRDIRRAAEVVGVPFNEEAITPILEAFGPRFQDSEVSLRTTNHPVAQRDLSVRYVNVTLPEDNPYEVAVERGFLLPDDHPVHRLYADIRARLPMIGSGVDSVVSSGMQKIWPFVRGATPEDIYTLPSIPPSVQQHDGYFKKYGLESAWLFAIDYKSRTMNIYFNFLPAAPGMPHDRETIVNMITDLGFRLPPDEEIEANRGNVMIYLTFSWDSPKCLRASFVIPHGPADQFPRLDPFLNDILDKIPTLTKPTIVGMQTAYVLDGPNYLKAEFDYTGTMVNALKGVVMGQL